MAGVAHCGGALAPILYSEERFCAAVDDLAPPDPPGRPQLVAVVVVVAYLVEEDAFVGAAFPVAVNARVAEHWTHDNDQHLRYRTGLKTRIHRSMIGLQ